MYQLNRTTRFEKSFKKIKRNKYFKISEFEEVLRALLNGEILDRKYKDHKLQGKYIGYRECHIQNDILLIYFKNEQDLILVFIDIGSHSQLF